MRRSLLRRSFGTLLALWFAIAVADPQWLHECPMHTAAAAPVPSVAAAAGSAGHEGHGQAERAGHQGHQARDEAPAHGHGNAHCLCIGQCAPGVVLTLATVPEVPVATVVVIEARGVLPQADYVPVVRERTLPFATAPPAL